MYTGARAIVLVVVGLAAFGDAALSQSAPRDYQAFIRSEINKCVADAVRIDKETGVLNHPTAPTQAQRVASCRELVEQVNDLYPTAPEPKKKGR
jgi:hypothetical protein